MLLGRLEILAVLVLLSPAFWRHLGGHHQNRERPGWGQPLRCGLARSSPTKGLKRKKPATLRSSGLNSTVVGPAARAFCAEGSAVKRFRSHIGRVVASVAKPLAIIHGAVGCALRGSFA